jgi:UDP-N-acetylmuramoyl-tripeptide--D-alanyl-D-alanine ligase
VPLTILSAEPHDQILLLELGTNHPGEIGYLTRIVRPDVALVTFAGPAHLEGFGTIEKIIAEKLSIADGLVEGGMLIVNGDQAELGQYLNQKNRPFITFGLCDSCDIRAEEMLPGAEGGFLTIEGRRISIPLAGRAGLCNALAAWAVCWAMDLPLDEFEKGCAGIEPVSMRCVIRKLGSALLLEDCYNANPVSMDNALDCLCLAGREHPGSRRVFVAGAMAELGDDSKRMHFNLGEKACRAGVGLLLAAGPFASDIVGGAIDAGLEPACCGTFADTGVLCDNLHRFVRPDDIILVKGSRVAALERAVRTLEELFSRQADKNEAII